MKLVCDSNVFLALATGRHPHHQAAVTWIAGLDVADQACFCRATQQSFLRLLTVREVMSDGVLSNDEASATLRNLQADSRVRVLEEEPPGVEKQWLEFAAHRTAAPKLWMDAYLAAVAFLIGSPLVTFDRGFRRFDKLKVVVLG
jgi:uncharacterized protein